MSRQYAEALKSFGKKKVTKKEVLAACSPVYSKPGEPGFRTKQSFKDSCDINQILKQARKGGVISHVNTYGAQYGDFAEIPDGLLEAEMQRQEAFEALPSEIRREFNQDAGEFFRWAHQLGPEEAIAEMNKLAPDGDQRVPDVLRGGHSATSEVASAPESASSSEVSPDKGDAVSEPENGSGSA